MDNQGMSASDVIAMTKETDGFGGSGWWIIILFFAIMMNGGWGNGFGNAIGYENLSTSNEVQRGFDNQNSMANQREILAAVNAGTMQTTNTVNESFHNLVGYFGDKYNEITRDLGGIAAGQQAIMAKQQECCCEQLRAIDQVNFLNAQNKNEIVQAVVAEGQATRALMQENKIEALQQKVNELQLEQQMVNVVRYPVGYAYNAGPSPFCCCNKTSTDTTTGA